MTKITFDEYVQGSNIMKSMLIESNVSEMLKALMGLVDSMQFIVCNIKTPNASLHMENTAGQISDLAESIHNQMIIIAFAVRESWKEYLENEQNKEATVSEPYACSMEKPF